MALANRDTSVPAENALPPLCVDLDGTLIHTDLLVESALALLARAPWMLLAMLFWLLRAGKAGLKQEIARRVELNVAVLPYNEELVAWVRKQHTQRITTLCTASDATLAECVANHLGIFHAVIASDGTRNLSGSNKAQTLVERYGEQGFDYVGNAKVDLHIWRRAHAAIVVEPGSRLTAAVMKVTQVDRTFKSPTSTLRAWIKALRLHQWIKNVLVFLPILAAHRVLDIPSFIASVVAFVCFGLCASSVYITNDLLDLTADRQHQRKKLRPFAAGVIPLYQGPLAAALLLLMGFTIAFQISLTFAAVMAGYYVLTTAYSLKLKRVVMLDVVVLATLYTTRILAGAAAIHTPASFWLLAFSMFIFLSLAMIKRYVELLSAQKAGKVKPSGRGYDVEDISLIQSLGSSSGYLAVLVLALYIDSTASSALYRHPHYLWMLCPLLLYWISRTWAIAHRGIMHDDPVVFAVMDKTSRILLVLAGIILAASI
jgi:4-hydroxybenzoate polyprenyltransferase/phosphoserine phosphatase